MKKNFMKKIIVGIFSFALLFVAQSAFAAVTWNQASNECKGISIVNATTNQGYINPCWPLSSVSAKGGDMINVRIYYHNTGNETAKNASVSVRRSHNNNSTSHSFTGRIMSDNGSVSLSPVNATISSSQTLTFHSAKWYTGNTAEKLTPLLGSDSDVLTDTGLSIGSVAPGWASQGSVVVAFKVSGNANTVEDNECTIDSFTANGGSTAYIDEGDDVNIAWDTENCTVVSVTGSGLSSSLLSGSKTVYPTSSNTYTITARADSGSSISRTVRVEVDGDNNGGGNNDCSIEEFTIDGDTGTVYVEEDDNVRIVWETEDCDTVRVSGPDFSSSAKNDSRTIYPDESGTYTITARGDDGNISRSIRVRIEDNDDNYCSINNFRVNGSSSVNVTTGQPVTLSWNTSGCDYVNIPGVGTSLPASYSYVVSPSSSMTYILNAYSYYGNTRTDSVRVNVNNIIIPPTNTCAVTTIATNVGQNYATLNGVLNSSTGVSYFEYGTNSAALSNRTVSRSGSGSFMESISGLASNTTYYFRLVSNCGGGLSYGSINIFRTTGGVVINNTRTIIQGTTVIGTSSPIMLTIENRYQALAVGDMIDYTVTYKNIGKSILTNPLVQVVVPEGIVITNASAGTYSRETNTLNVPINDLYPDQEGVIYLQARVERISSLNAQIVTTAILVYTNPSGAQENAIAYVLNSPKEIFQTNVLGASAFWSGIWGMGLIGWLLLLILILLIILATRRYSTSKTVVHNNPTHPNVPNPHY